MWTPSYVQASGDVGDLTFCHHAAFRTFDGAMSWLAGNSTDYQLSKTTAKKEPSLEKTIEYIEHQIVYAKDELEEHVDPSTQEGIDSMMTIIEELRWKENPDLIPDIIFSSGLFDDYYGSYEYRWRDVFVLECVRLAARQYLWEEENAKLSEKCL